VALRESLEIVAIVLFHHGSQLFIFVTQFHLLGEIPVPLELVFTLFFEVKLRQFCERLASADIIGRRAFSRGLGFELLVGGFVATLPLLMDRLVPVCLLRDLVFPSEQTLYLTYSSGNSSCVSLSQS